LDDLLAANHDSANIPQHLVGEDSGLRGDFVEKSWHLSIEM
jgi:hypothetical protein